MTGMADVLCVLACSSDDMFSTCFDTSTVNVIIINLLNLLYFLIEEHSVWIEYISIVSC